MGEYQVCIPSGTKIGVFGLERRQTLLVRWDSGRTGPLNSVSAKVSWVLVVVETPPDQ